MAHSRAPLQIKPKMKIGITLGDPRGIGREIIQKSLADSTINNLAEFIIYGDSSNESNLSDWSDEKAGHACISYLESAVHDALEKKIDAIVTAPISKSALQKAGYSWPGHTEFFAERTNTKKFVMMMASPKLKVTLVTIHVPLKEVSKLLTEEKIIDTVKITYDFLQKWWGIESPRIAVCGLNPHAGEQGVLGDEEIKIIAPAIQKLFSEGYPVEGPLVPDAVFHQAYEGKYHAVVCMYHDQGLIPFKMLHFRDGVNVTLGLPIIRTSPDHGTGFDIAGKGIADPSSMKEAIKLAINIVLKKS